jgi:hypothetical protein
MTTPLSHKQQFHHCLQHLSLLLPAVINPAFKANEYLHSSYGKSIIERTIQYVKDRTECFDDYFPCRKERCKLKHVMKWLLLFVHMYNKEVIEKVKTGK